MQPNVDKLDIRILCILFNQEITSPLDGLQIQNIIDSLEMKIAYYTIVKRIQKLILKGLVAEGYKQRNAKTYYLSSSGIEMAIRLIEDENIVFEKENNNNEGEE